MIINTIVTAFFNNTTVLFASYNNVPIDNVFEKLTHLEYHGQTIPFPVLRLGNIDKVKAAISYINRLRNQVQTVKYLRPRSISARMTGLTVQNVFLRD